MSTATEVEPIPDRTDAEKIARNVALRYSGHEAVMLGEMVRTKRMAEKLQKFAATGKADDLDFTPAEEAEMAVNLGNETHYHLTGSPPQYAPTGPVKSSRLWPLLAATLIGASGPLVFGAIANWSRQPSPPPAAYVAPETDWKLGIEVHD